MLIREPEFKPQNTLSKKLGTAGYTCNATGAGEVGWSPWASLARLTKASPWELTPRAPCSLKVRVRARVCYSTAAFSLFLSICPGTKVFLFCILRHFTFSYLKHEKRRKGDFIFSFPHDPSGLEKLGESITLCSPSKAWSDSNQDSRYTCIRACFDHKHVVQPCSGAAK